MNTTPNMVFWGKKSVHLIKRRRIKFKFSILKNGERVSDTEAIQLCKKNTCLESFRSEFCQIFKKQKSLMSFNLLQNILLKHKVINAHRETLKTYQGTSAGAFCQFSKLDYGFIKWMGEGLSSQAMGIWRAKARRDEYMEEINIHQMTQA